MSDDLMAFLSACMDEDEEAAREAADGDSGSWFMGDKWNVYRAEDEAAHDDDYQGPEHKLVVYGNVKPQSEHIARYNPARALAEVAAKRALMERHAVHSEPEVWGDSHPDPAMRGQPTGGTVYWCNECDHDRDYGYIGSREEGCPTARILAAIYSNRPGYRPEWKP